MSDLYQVLGVRRAASQDEIRRAYRRKAKILHPDAGGSVGAFGEIATAYGVLSDATRRERYDRTGQVENTQPDDLDGSAIEIIAQKFGMILFAEQDVISMDIAGLVEQAIHEDIAQRRSNISSQKRAVQRVMMLRARVKRKNSGENVIARVLDWHELSTTNLIKRNEEAVGLMNRALEILQDYWFCNDVSSTLPGEESDVVRDPFEAKTQPSVDSISQQQQQWC
jgi:hypothetical protein